LYSVIISSIGRFDYLNELLESILNQTIKPSEIIFLLEDNDHCKNNDVVTAYRNYYIQEKSYFAKWKFVKQPDWFNEGVNNANIRL